LKFYASQRLEIRRGDKIEQDKELIGFVTKISVKKNKVAPPFKKAEIPVLFAEGYYRSGDIVEAALAYDLITRAGAFYTCGEHKLQGKDRLVAHLLEHEDVLADLEKDIQNKIKEIRTGKAEVPEQDATTAEEEILAEKPAKASKNKVKNDEADDVDSVVDEILG
jgi:recombination protein RecA